MSKDASLTVRLPSDLKARLEAEAEADGRKLSNLVEKILTDWLDAKPKRRTR